MAPANRLAAVAAALLLLGYATARAAEADDAGFFADRLTAERGERLRLAASLDPDGWPALRALALKATRIETLDPMAPIALAKLDESVVALAERLKSKLRQGPLDALEALARADLAMLRAAEGAAPKFCATYLWPDPVDVLSLRRAARAAGREAELARLRAIQAAATLKARNPTYYDTQISEEQAQLRAQGLAPSEIAFAAASARPPGVDDKTACRATIRYLDAVLGYPAKLRSTTLAWRMSGDYGDGDE